MIDLEAQLTVLRDWSVGTFGADRSLEYNCRHIESELVEVRADPRDPVEWMDIAILAFDGAMRAGHTPEDVARVFVDKLKVIQGRTYVRGENGLMRHT